MAWIQFEQIFKDMKVGTDLVDVNHESIPDDLSDYETVVVLLSDLSPLKENVLKISDWVKEGGSAMFALTLQKDTYVSLIEQKLGIVSICDPVCLSASDEKLTVEINAVYHGFCET